MDTDGNPIAFASVYAWNFDGSLRAIRNQFGRTIHLVCSTWKKYGRLELNIQNSMKKVTRFITQPPFDLDIDLRDSVSAADVIVTIKASDFLIPEGISETFDPFKGFHHCTS